MSKHTYKDIAQRLASALSDEVNHHGLGNATEASLEILEEFSGFTFLQAQQPFSTEIESIALARDLLDGVRFPAEVELLDLEHTLTLLTQAESEIKAIRLMVERKAREENNG